MRKPERLTNYDPAEDLNSGKAVAVFIAEAFKTGDPAYFSHALGVVESAIGNAKSKAFSV
jgi:probable addiction module antidote protein